MDPISAGLAVAGAGVQAVGSLKAGNANSKALRKQAREELVVGAAEEARVREAARMQMGEQVAAQFGNGLEGGSGSALDALRESKINAALDTLEIRRQARLRSDELTQKAKQAKTQGRFSAASAILGGASQVAGQATDWADARRGRTG